MGWLNDCILGLLLEEMLGRGGEEVGVRVY